MAGWLFLWRLVLAGCLVARSVGGRRFVAGCLVARSVGGRRFVALSFPLAVCVAASRVPASPVGGCSERVFMLAYLCFVWFL